MLKLILLGELYVALLMCVVWLLYYGCKRPHVVDAAWPVAITLACINYMFSTSVLQPQRILLVLLVVWCVRLSGYLIMTRLLAVHLDKRYEAISEKWTVSQSVGFFINYQFQGVLAVLIATPFLFIRQINSGNNLIFSVAIALVIIGIIGETVADWQLTQSRKNRPGRVCDSGLWRYSRHPNYFFEWLIWVGFAMSAWSVAWGWVALLSPLLLLFIMIKITGPITERASIKSRGKPYLEYQSRTSLFLPLPPRKT